MRNLTITAFAAALLLSACGEQPQQTASTTASEVNPGTALNTLFDEAVSARKGDLS